MENSKDPKDLKLFIKNIFSNALNKAKYAFTDKSNGTKAYERLENDERITFKPKSLRYTYSNRPDNKFDKKWKPGDSENPDDKLSPEGYFRPETAKKINRAYDRSVENPDREEDFNKTNRDFFKEKDEENSKNEETKYNERRNISVDSTCIKKFDYDPKNEGLTVQFQGNSKKYFYPKVPKSLIKKWMEASSKGEYFLSNIHDQYSMNPSHKSKNNRRNKNFYKWFKKNYKGSKK